MSSSIIGFSLALLSARIFQPNNIDAEIVKDSWIFFVLAIILGVACLIIESHLEFSHTWHVLLYDVTPASEQYTFMEKFKGLLLFLVALLFPANLIVKMKRKNPDSAKRINDITLTYLWTSMRLIFIAEKFVFVLFIVGVIYLIRSYK
ncbi:MAG: hypothetical protein Q8R32_01895 [bacterium]|nr:hypothetical protein [bacterium]